MSSKNKVLSPSDELILEVYRMGWDNCFSGDDSNRAAFKESKILDNAYTWGWSDYIVGDDVSSIDMQTDKQILKKIKSL